MSGCLEYVGGGGDPGAGRGVRGGRLMPKTHARSICQDRRKNAQVKKAEIDACKMLAIKSQVGELQFLTHF